METVKAAEREENSRRDVSYFCQFMVKTGSAMFDCKLTVKGNAAKDIESLFIFLRMFNFCRPQRATAANCLTLWSYGFISVLVPSPRTEIEKVMN